MNKQEMYARTKDYALRVIKMVGSMPKSLAAYVLGKQLIRSATSIGANYREAAKAKSRADFLSKLKICESEAEESYYWLELIADSEIMPRNMIGSLLDETHQLCAIFSAMVKTTKSSS